MPRKAHLVKASLINKLTKTTGKTFSVVATVSNTNVSFKKLELATFGCESCKTEFASEKGSAPFCVTCSSDKVAEIKSSNPVENLAKINSSELASVTCGNCHTHNVLSMETAEIMDTKMHCITCGTEIEYSLDEEESNEEDTDLDEEILTEEPTGLDEEDDADLTETSELNDNDHTGSDVPATETKVDTQLEPETISLPTVSEQEVKPTNTENSEVTDTGVSSGKLTVPDTEEFALLNVIEGSLEVKRVGDVIVASKNNIPVATLEISNAGEHKGIFHSKTLINGINHTAKSYGDETALNSFNFELTKVKLPIPAIVESRVEALVKSKSEKVESKLKDLNEDFQQCLALAYVGLNKGYFKGKTNVLKESLVSKLRALGCANPEKVVTSAFSQHSNEYHKTTIEVANSLMLKSVEHRNELAETFGDINIIDEDVDYDDDENDSLEARLETASIKSRKENKPTEISSVTQLVDAVKKVNGRLF